MRRAWLILLAAVVATMLTVGWAQGARADLTAGAVSYTIDGQPYEGYFAINQRLGDAQPLVILVHDWNGLDSYERRRAEMLAERGYAAFAVDLYGQGVRPQNVEESRAESGKLYADRAALRARLLAGLAQAQQQPGVDGDRVVAMGYCFGGAAVLEMARAGVEVDGFVSFHGSFATPEGQDYTQTQGSLLVLHGSDDPVAPMTDVAQLAAELDGAGVTFDMEIYGGADHAFTVWSDQTRYNAEADRKSWRSLLIYLEETFSAT
ncbi:MAG TPA: dienelactone hydrolase family protein [Leptolyngbyaceae cyanobacterium M65_K2018_010]|nr:dienelactone hydrolase family protein [Leptolyngbyaceae cyanobacterium M65_K2018_010]